RQLPAFAGLGVLCHLDLRVFGVNGVFAGDAEPCRRELLDRAPPPVTIGVAGLARRVFAAFAGVRLAADPVHRNRQRLVRFLTDRSVGHRAGREALHDAVDRLDLVDRNRWTVGNELEQAAQRGMAPAL